nr:hypothetical protein [Tanacetum cinerariifolium]
MVDGVAVSLGSLITTPFLLLGAAVIVAAAMGVAIMVVAVMVVVAVVTTSGEPMHTHKAPNFVQPSEHVKTPRPSVEHPIPATTLRKDIPKTKGHRQSRNKKACFVCKSLTHLIKDCDYYKKKMVQKPVRNHSMRGNHQHYARMTHPNPHKHVVTTAILTRSRLIPLTAARPVTTIVSPINVTSPRPAKTVVNMPHSPLRRPINHRPSPKPTRLVVYQQNETVFEEDIKLLKLDVMLRDNALAELRKKFEKAEQERDDSDSDVSMPPIPVHDRYQSGEGYHVVPPPYTGTFMPTKPDLVFHDALTINETDLTALPCETSPTKRNKDLSQTNRPSAPIIEDWVSYSKNESEGEPMHTHKAPNFVQPSEHVKTSRPSVDPRPAKTVVNMPHSPLRRPINHRPSPKPSNFPQKFTTVKAPQGNPQHVLNDKRVIDSGCSRHMTGNISYLSDFEAINEGYIAFGVNPKGGKITGKDTECIVLSSDFKLPYDNHVLLRVPRENNMYNVDLNNIVPSGDLTCLFAKATLDESNLWHRRLGHINFKTINKLVNGNLVRGLPSKVFENNHTCVACKKGKQHRASLSRDVEFEEEYKWNEENERYDFLLMADEEETGESDEEVQQPHSPTQLLTQDSPLSLSKGEPKTRSFQEIYEDSLRVLAIFVVFEIEVLKGFKATRLGPTTATLSPLYHEPLIASVANVNVVNRSIGTDNRRSGHKPGWGLHTVKTSKNTLRDYYCWLKTYYCWYKLKLLDKALGSRLRLLEENVAADEKMKKLL